MMDTGLDDEQVHAGHDVQAADEGSGDLNCHTGSPMQQSPDQSNYHDNYRSPEPAMEEQEMDTADLNDVESEHSDLNVDAKHEWTADDSEIVNQDADASNQVADDLVCSEGADAQEHHEMLSESNVHYSNEDNDEIGSSNAQVESTDKNFEENSNIDNENDTENNEADFGDDLDVDQNIENDDLVESSEGKVEFENEDNVSSEGGIRHAETTEFRAFGDSESSQSSNEDETTFNKDGVQAFESNEGETDSNNADTSSGMSRINSFIDVVSENDKTVEENATDKSSEFKLSEVTSTSSVDNGAAITDSANEVNEMDAKRNDEIENIEHVVDEIESSDIVHNFSNVKGMDRERVLKDVKSHLNASSTDLDNYSTVSIKGSISSSDNESDNELDLTQPSDKYDSENVSQNQCIDQEYTSNIDNDTGDESVNVSSSTNCEDNTESKLDITKTDDDTEIDKVDSGDANVDTSKQEDSQDEDKKSEASLEEISEEEDGLDDDSAAVTDHHEKVDTAQLSGMEEVSSEEEEVEDDEDDDKKKEDVKGKTDLKAESGMEEVSDEEEESGDGQLSEDGMENVSSDEEEIVEEKPEDNLDKHDHVQQTNTDDKVNQTAEIIEKDEIDDTGKDDDSIIKEILENLLRKLGKADKDESKESDIKRRKNRDKRDRKDSVKYSRRLNEKRDSVKNRRESVKDRRESVKDRRDGAKDKRDSVKDRRESVKDRRESVKTRSRDTRDINERLKAQASYGDDELDYDDTVHDETREKQGSDSEGEITSSSSSEGELDEEECEEGEIMEPGSKPYVKPTCRFFMRGHCTWGINCRFLHPGVNDKGNYQLIERPGFNNKPPGAPFDDKWEEEEVERTPSPEPPPPPPEPKEETAWERGLRQAKELRKKAMEKREMETNFEHKKMNLSIEDNPEFDKENNLEKSPVKSPVKKTPYYDKYEPLSDDEYYDQTPVRLQQKQMEQSWMTGGYENFQVHWSQDQYGPPPHHLGPYPPPMGRYPYPPDRSMRGHERFPLRPSPRRLSGSPPDQRQRYMRPPPRDPREMISREKMREPHMSPPSPTKKLPPANTARADDWHDPWTRANANKAKSPKKRSRSRGRRRSRRSYSYSSSYSSSSYSGSSRSRSSSFSSVSSRSSRSSSFSRSRSPAPRTGPRMRGMRRPVPAGNQPMRRPSAQARPNEPTRGAMAMQGRPERGIDKRPGVPSPNKGVKGSAPVLTRQTSKPGGQQIADVGRARKPPPKMAAGPQQPQKPLPQSALTKDKAKPKQGIRKRKASSSSSRSRSRSRSSSSSSRTSYSSRSSRSYSRSRSRSSSSSSSGSADSDHLYRNIGARENQKGAPPGAGRGKQDMARHPPAGGRVPQGRPGVKPTIGETSRPSSVAQAKMVKDPLKMTGQKSNIKLTLIKQSERPPPGAVQEPVSRKRPAEPVTEAPPMKRHSVPNPPKIDKPVKKPEKAVPVSPAKVAGRVAGPVKPAAGAPGAATVTVKKKSTVSRREELLKQLKAVEDAIAKKKKKMG